MNTLKSILIPLVLAASLILSACNVARAGSAPPEPVLTPAQVAVTANPNPPSKPSTAATSGPMPTQMSGAMLTGIEIQPSTDPGQVIAVVSGSLSESCATLGAPQVSYNAQTFMILLTVVSPSDIGCAQINTPFKQSIPLDVANLQAGDYTVKVDGVSAMFKLPLGQSQIPNPDASGDPGQVETYTSDLYGFQFNIPAGFSASVDKDASEGSNPEYITISKGNDSGLPRFRIMVQTGISPITGFENCEKNLTFRSLSACRISNPGGQAAASEVLIFQNGAAYYFIIMEYADPGSLPLFDELLSSFQFTK